MTTFALSNRRNWIQGLGALSACAQSGRPQRHFVVVGAGIFGAWTAYHLLRAGQRVTLIDQYGPANSRASSGGESRIIRARYGNDVVYTSFALRSLQLWQRFLNETSLHRLYHRVGALWMARQSDPRFAAHLQTLRKLGAEVHSFDNTELKRRYPQIHVDDDVAAILEPNAGGLMARQAVQAVVTEFVKKGGVYRQSRIQEPAGTSRLQELIDHRSERIAGDAFVFAAGPWLKTLLPGVLGDRIFPTRQVVFFYGPPPGDSRFAPPAMPAWGDAFSDLP
ncbi:MAG: FAD-dependent oxidoreductase, partial [Acidobacteria bacterium]|nr:FAD-dependent oxidoreductase [Acidobacteriota bacterium]